MGAMTGKLFYLEFDGTVLSGDYRSFGNTQTGGVVDASAGADANRTYLTTLKDGTATASVVMQTGAGSLLWIVMAPLNTGVLRWGEEGSNSGSVMHTVSAIVTERRKSAGYADLVIADVTWQFNGGVGDATF